MTMQRYGCPCRCMSITSNTGPCDAPQSDPVNSVINGSVVNMHFPTCMFLHDFLTIVYQLILV